MPRLRLFETARLRLAAGMLLLPVAACSVLPAPVTDAEREARRQYDLQEMFKGQEPITGPVTLDDAIARAIRYNLDHRVKRMELAFAAGQRDVQSRDLLPRLSVSAGYDARNNDSGGESLSILTGQQSLQPSSSSPRAHGTASAGLAWNALDLGVSYLRAREQADQVLVSEERRRKVIQNIIQDVTYAWWRAASAQRVLPQLDALRQRVNFAMDHSLRIESQHLMPPLQALAYQRALLDIEHTVVQQRNQLITAKTELAALMNLKPGGDFQIALPPENPAPPQPLADNIATLEDMALVNRPELREEDVRRRISREQARRALLSLLPGIDLSLTRNYDSNSLLYNNTWSEAGLTLSGNLMKLFSYGATKRMNQAQSSLDDARRQALAAAVLTQLHIAREHYNNNWIDYQLLEQAEAVDRRIAESVRSATRIDAESELELIRAEARAVLSHIQRDVAYASLQADFARIVNSIGVDPAPPDMPIGDLKSLSAAVARNSARFSAVMAGSIRQAAPDESVALYFAPIGGATEGQQSWARQAFARMIKGSGVRLAPASAPGGFSLAARMALGKAVAGVVRIDTVWELRAADGELVGQFRYTSYLTEPTTAPEWQAYMEGSANAAASQLLPRVLFGRRRAALAAPAG